MAELFKVATGWLGWPPRTALTTPIPQILLAQEGMIDWNRKLWGGGDSESKPEAKGPVGDRLKAAFRAMGAKPPTAPGESDAVACTAGSAASPE